jgi:hypothetical protein
MKTSLTPLFALAALCTAVPGLWADTTAYYDGEGPSTTSTPGFHVGFANGTADPIQSLRMGYEVKPATGGDPAYGLGTFDILHATGATWQWRWDNLSVNAPVTAMELTPDGAVRLFAPAVSTYVRSLKLDPATASITFGAATSGGTARTLAMVGATLQWDGAALLTPASSQTLNDARYLQIVQNRLQFGASSLAQTDYSIALGKAVRANGTGAVALGATDFDGATPYELYAAGKGATALGYGAQAYADGATAIGWHSVTGARGSVAIGEGNWIDSAASQGVAIGYGNLVTTVQGVALGLQNGIWASQGVALGWGNYINEGANIAFAAGALNQVYGSVSVALGGRNLTHGAYSTAIGFANESWGDASLALGDSNKAYGSGAIALGKGSYASGTSALAAGNVTKATNASASAFGDHTEASGQASTAIGSFTKAIGPNQLVVGAYNEPIVDPSGTPGNPNDAAFIVGNGFATTNSATPPVTTITRNNALVVLWNGTVKASGGVTASGPGGFTAPGTIKAVNGKVLVPLSGDIDMGEFATGEQP